MNEVTQILNRIGGDPSASEQLLPLIYNELRRLAAAKMAGESPDHTLQATALVHEAYLRLVNKNEAQRWESRGHFFSAAAEAMRRILIDQAHRKNALKRGGDCSRIGLAEVELTLHPRDDDVLVVNEALDQLAEIQPQTAELVKLRYFAGFTNKEAAQILGISPRRADSLWAYARAWLHERISAE